MIWTRRDAIKGLGVAGAAAALGPMGASAARGRPAQSPLRILFIGGTGFIGPHMVRRALERGHVVTLFNRGRTNPHLFPEVEKHQGDRDGGLEPLRGRSWDAVIDTSGYVPRVVRDSAELLREEVHRYVFVSSADAYADFVKVGITEDYTLDTIDDPTIEDAGRYYGPLKVLCERVVQELYPGRATVLRPGWIVGAGDYNPISSYWPMRVHHGGEMLAPGRPEYPIQYIDPHDLARFVVNAIENDVSGTFNMVGPGSRLSMAEFLYGIRAVTTSAVRFTWVPDDFLLEMNVGAQTDLPIWFPPRDDYPTGAPFEPGAKGFHQISGARAVAAGLEYRPLADTARSIIEEYLSRGTPWSTTQRRFGLSLEREAEVLAAWRARRG